MTFIPAELIKKKRRGETHSDDELNFLISSFTSGQIPDYQMSAWLMAVCFQGMTDAETATLTRTMRDSGQVLDFSRLRRPVIDKHSTGGVGDKTSLVVAPVAAAAGVPVPMIAGRGLGHTGGTLDKLESIPGFSINMTLEEFQSRVGTYGLAIAGQTEAICPADKKLYALRDVTGTVESLPLICGSIMSKKLAEGLSGLVLDVKYGSGAFMKTLENAKALAQLLKSIGERNGVKVVALLTNMNQPLGRAIGNALEVEECLAILRGETQEHFADTRELSLALASWMIVLGGVRPSLTEARGLAEEVLSSGKALKVFEETCRRQGARALGPLPRAKHQLEVNATTSGYVATMDTESIGLAALLLGAGRFSAKDVIDFGVGLECLKKVGDFVEAGQCLFRIHANDQARVTEVQKRLLASVKLSAGRPLCPPLVAETLA